jgi:uncharacterized cupredoxin-like copper-binding protein
MRPLPILLAALAAGGLSFAALASPGHDHGPDAAAGKAYGQPGDPGKPPRIVRVSMREAEGRMMFVPDRIEVRKGEQVRLRLRNDGELDHELVLATLEENLAHMKAMENAPDMAHDEANARRLNPRGTAEIVWHFTRAGEFDFSCLIPGHRQLGMSGTLVVR